jgi:hypothetical protein
MTMNQPLTQTVILLDPTAERRPVERPAAPRPATLAGRVIALVDISKPRGNVFLDRCAQLLEARGATVRRYTKPTFTKPAPPDLRRRISQECEAAIEALAD